jgi:hypothetical protein
MMFDKFRMRLGNEIKANVSKSLDDEIVSGRGRRRRSILISVLVL